MELTAVKTATNADILELIEKRREIYIKDPLLIVEHYNSENKVIGEYEGRQLLEMIQNANDESDTHKSKKVKIVLEENTLLIANNGNPFSVGGVESLIYSDLSPKVLEQNKVGQKGLGFRSILNWAEEIYIASYDLHLKFSKEHAKEFLESIIEEKPEIRSILKRKTNASFSISVLRCPHLEADISRKRENDYDTVIELSLRRGISADIKMQIAREIIPEILVFLNKLDEIEVLTDEQHFILKKEFTENGVLVTKNDLLDPTNNGAWEWFIEEENGILEKESLSKNYELKIAYNPEIEPAVKKVFSFFRTDIDFPYPVMVHGSFELTGNRNQLIDDENGFNRILIAKLAKLLSSCAVKLTKENKCNYEALKLIIPSVYNSSTLNNFPWNFKDTIESQIREIAVFPSMNNQYIKLYDNIRFYDTDLRKVIPKNARLLFGNLLQSTEDMDIIHYLKGLKINLKYSDAELTGKINKMADSLSERQTVEWIYLLCEKTKEFYSEKDPVLPQLLLNDMEKKITKNEAVIIPPEELTYSLPKEIKLQFLSPSLLKKIRSRFGNMTVRQLTDKLRLYRVAEYAMNVVVQKIVSSTNEAIKNPKKNRNLTVGEMHKALYSIYASLEGNADAKEKYPAGLTSPFLITRNENIKEATKLYFGKEYACGYFMEDLLKNVKDDIFAGSMDQNALLEVHEESLNKQDNPSVESYLKWLGVADFPKRIPGSLAAQSYEDKRFLKYNLESINFPFITLHNNEKIDSIMEMKVCWDFKCTVLWYEHFEQILEGGSFEHLVSWFLMDMELHNSLITNQEFKGAEFRFAYPKKQYFRYLPNNLIRSYIYFRLQQIAFIPVENGKKARPKDCLLDSNNLSPLVKTPQINYKASVFAIHGIDAEQINYFLKRIGIKDTLQDLSMTAIYTLLNNHNVHYAKTPGNIQSFYSAIIEATKNKETIDENEARKEFFENGEIYALHEGRNCFVAVKDATYVDNPNFSQELLKKLKIAKLPNRSGNIRMLNLFGVQPLDHIKFYADSNIECHNGLNEAFLNEFIEIKPRLFAYRFQKGLKKSQYENELSAIKNLKIQLVHKIGIRYVLNGQPQELSLKKYEYIEDAQTKMHYVKLDESDYNYHDLKKDYRFKETIADIICGALKVTENRKDFLLLLGEEQSNWTKMLKREFEDYQNIENQILERFNGLLSSEMKFWKILLEIKNANAKDAFRCDFDFIYDSMFLKMQKDDFFSCYRSIDYNDLNAISNIGSIKKIFNFLDIDLEDFNYHNYKILNFEKHLLNEVHTFHKIFAQKFASFQYNKRQSAGFVEKNEQLSSFNSFSVRNSVTFDTKMMHKAVISQNFGGLDYQGVLECQVVEIQGIYAVNLKAFETELRRMPNFSYIVFNDMKYESRFKNAVFFNDLEQLKKVLAEKFDAAANANGRNKVMIGDSSVHYSETDYDDLMSLIEKQVAEQGMTLEHYNPSKTSSSPKSESGCESTGQSFNGRSKKYKNEDIGFIGEKFAFELLKKEYDSVVWISEYAIKAGFSEGRDGLGYDFECRKGNETRFVEVKSSVTKNYSFNISTKEVEIGHSKEKSFDILVITNLFSSDINFKYLKNMFLYDINESFLQNKKFRVENDNYKIRFK